MEDYHWLIQQASYLRDSGDWDGANRMERIAKRMEKREMTDDEALDAIDRHPVPTCAHPRALLSGKERDTEGRTIKTWQCPDCGKSGGYVVTP